jgi:hypothetical protein
MIPPTQTSPRSGQAPRRLPALRLQGPSGPIGLRAPERGSLILLLVRDQTLDRARPYIASLTARVRDLADFDGRPLLVTEAATPDTDLASANLPTDQWRALGIGDGSSALIIADRWGAVYFTQQFTTVADLPSVAEVEAWIRYLATQCPECGVPDEPGHGEWSYMRD